MPNNNEELSILDLLAKDVLLMPGDYLFGSDSVKFAVNFTNKNRDAVELNSEDLALIAAIKNKLIKCRIKSVLADDLAAVKIEIEPGKFLYADIKITSKDALTGISIFRYVASKDIASPIGTASPSISPTLTPSSPSGSRPRSALLALFSKGSSGSKQLLKKWHGWDLSATSQDVMQLLQANEPFSAFNLNLDAEDLEAKRRLVVARRRLLNYERFSDVEAQQWTDSRIIKDIIVKKLKFELQSIDVFPNLFEAEFTPRITELFNIYKVIGNESEIESDIANVYEIILQSLFPQNQSSVVVGNIIAAWSHDKDKIKDLIHKTALMDLLSVLNMVCADKKIIEGMYRRQYPKMIMAAEEVVTKYVSTYLQKQDDGAGSPTQSRGKSVLAKDMAEFERRFEKLRRRAPQVRPEFYI
jgi:hypothetical protein